MPKFNSFPTISLLKGIVDIKKNEGGENLKNKKLLIFVAIVVVIVVFLIFARNPILKIIYPRTYEEAVLIYSEEYGVDDNLILALIKAESNFDANAISNRNAIGLMQLMQETAKDVANQNGIELDDENIEQELSDVYKNVQIGTCYLATLLKRYENKEIALAAYNAGIGTVDNWIDKGIIKADGSDIENIPYKETNYYVRKILRDYEFYNNLY